MAARDKKKRGSSRVTARKTLHSVFRERTKALASEGKAQPAGSPRVGVAVERHVGDGLVDAGGEAGREVRDPRGVVEHLGLRHLARAPEADGQKVWQRTAPEAPAMSRGEGEGAWGVGVWSAGCGGGAPPLKLYLHAY